MGRSKSSHRWMKEHFEDEYVKKAQKEGYRSRAAYKLLELHEKDSLIQRGMTVVDLGSAPGGWSQVAAKLAGDKGRVVASDILEMDYMDGVEFIHGDFTENDVYEEILAAIGEGEGNRVNLVISDMAPNISGNDVVDQAKAMYLTELALDLATRVLKPGGVFVVKAFQGEGYDGFRAQVKAAFSSLSTRKPRASRPRSREVYLVAKGFKGVNPD